MIRVAIVEDEESYISTLKGYLEQYEKESGEQIQVTVYHDGDEIAAVYRAHMRIPQNQISLLESLSRVNENVVGILSAGAAIEMPWHPCLKGILHGYLYGQAGAGAMLDIITGKVNPSGRLNETYPHAI